MSRAEKGLDRTAKPMTGLPFIEPGHLAFARVGDAVAATEYTIAVAWSAFADKLSAADRGR